MSHAASPGGEGRCNLAVPTDVARFATSGVDIGLLCSAPMVAISRDADDHYAMEMLLTGELIDAAHAEAG